MNRPPSLQLGEIEPPSRINAIVANTVGTVLQMAIARVIIVLALIAAMGIGSVAIGFAVRRIFENLLAGIIILLRHERRFGDFIRCQGTKAGWGNILLRETHIPLTDDQLVIVPNSMLFKNPRAV